MTDKPVDVTPRPPTSQPEAEPPTSVVARVLLKVERLLASRSLFVLEVLTILALGAGLAIWLIPAPHSDWEYYWNAAGDARAYERGGFALWLLALPKGLGLSPVVSALLLNLPSAAIILWLAHRTDSSWGRLLALLVAAYLLLVAPFAGIVQLDLIAAMFMAGGFVVAMAAPKIWPRSFRMGSAAALFAAGVSTKPQYALIAWAMIGLVALPWWWLRRRSTSVAVSALLGALLLGSLCGFALDLGLRSLSGRSEAIRTTSAVTLYGGLLTSSNTIGCGHWSVEAAEAAKADLHKPLSAAVLDRLAEKPVAHWMSVLRCKQPHMTNSPPFALYWLVESPNIRARLDADPRRQTIDANYRRALYWETRAYTALTRIILLVVLLVAAALCARRAPLLGLLGVFWVASFWMVHLIFEIQGRYFLGMYLLAPLLCALAIRALDGNSDVKTAVETKPAVRAAEG